MEDLKTLKDKLLNVECRISKIEGVKYYPDAVSQSFHLGMVGGSGRNVASLNKRRERDLDKTISNAVLLMPMYRERDLLKYKINDIESGKYQKRIEFNDKLTLAKVEYWKEIKVGDKIDVGGNSPAEVTKKNAKSVETGSGCKWSASEIIGKTAANLL